MENNNLKMSPVIFDSLAHTYELNGHKLMGVTPIVNWVFNKTYDGISPETLARAAERGSGVHRACQLYDDCGLMDEEYTREVEAYRNICTGAGLQPLISEYLVSDEQDLASCIDKVFCPVDGCYPLADLKATSAYHAENVTLQLSLYAWLFEMQNPERKAGRLYCIWLPREKYGKPTLYEVQRIPSEVCECLVSDYAVEQNQEYWASRVLEYCPKLPTAIDGQLPANLVQAEREIARLELDIKVMTERSKELRAGLLELMQANGVKKWEGEHIIFTRKDGSVRTTLDTAKVKSQYPDVYAACCKESKTSESLMIKIK